MLDPPKELAALSENRVRRVLLKHSYNPEVFLARTIEKKTLYSPRPHRVFSYDKRSNQSLACTQACTLARAAPSLAGSVPPAMAMSGLPPPLPPS